MRPHGIEGGYQVAIMAPTRNPGRAAFFEHPVVLERLDLRSCLLSSSLKKAKKESLYQGSGRRDAYRHRNPSLIQEEVDFQKTGSGHHRRSRPKFGVLQRRP